MAIQHPWHELSPGPQLPEVVTAVIEIPKGQRTKYEIDKPSGLLRVDRLLPSSMIYPAHYGFIPQTMGADGDPLDIMVITSADVQALSIMQARVIGVMHMDDTGLPDEKILAVFTGDMSVSHIHQITDLPDHFFAEMRAFFNSYKELENKRVIVQDFLGREDAHRCLSDGLERYTQKFGKGA